MERVGVFGFLPFLLTSALLIAGCRGLPSYRLQEMTPHKDMVSLTVWLEDRAAPEVYQRIALDEAARVQSIGGHREFPLYEVKVEFRGKPPDAPKLAQVLVFLSGGPGGDAQVVQGPEPRMVTTLY